MQAPTTFKEEKAKLLEEYASETNTFIKSISNGTLKSPAEYYQTAGRLRADFVKKNTELHKKYNLPLDL